MSDRTTFVFRPERAQAFGRLCDGGFVVLKGSTAMRAGSPKVKRDRIARDELIASGVLADHADPELLVFTSDHTFTSSSRAADIIRDGNASGPNLWRDEGRGLTLKDMLAERTA